MEEKQVAVCGCDCAACLAGKHDECEKGPCDGKPVDQADVEQ